MLACQESAYNSNQLHQQIPFNSHSPVAICDAKKSTEDLLCVRKCIPSQQRRDLMAKRKEENFFSPENAKRPRQEDFEDFDKDGDEDECTASFTNGTSALTAAEVGIIESIELRNFMCHSMLGPFKFGSNVNFVVGNNGSKCLCPFN
uniref:Uncharacterized protein n=2 Tax=Oryctolagus cuniculus TaxID=9986 RepID=A0A5F9D5H7_RABIT